MTNESVCHSSSLHGQPLAPVAGVAAPNVVWGDTDQRRRASRKTRLRIFPSFGSHNALWYFPRATGGYAPVMYHAACIYLARYIPFIPLKNSIYRLVGMRVGQFVSVGLMAMFDIFFPQDITLGDNCIVGYNSTILCHEFLRHEWRRGPVWIGHNVMIGANTTILPGVVIGDGATVSAMSLVNCDIPPGAMAGGVPARIIQTSPAYGDDV